MDRKKDLTKYLLTLPIIALLSLLIMPLLTLFFGQTVLLQTIPQDPRDLFRGDYVHLEYEINKVPYEKLRMTQKELEGAKRVYVALKEKDGFHDVDFISIQKPKQLYLIGQPGNIWGFTEGRGELFLDYTIDTFFVEENTGTTLENLSRQGELIAEVKVYKNHSLLKSVTPKSRD